MDKTPLQGNPGYLSHRNNTQIRNTLLLFLFTGDDVFKLIK